MSKWTHLDKPITAEDAEAEPLENRLFGPNYDLRQQVRRRRREGIDKASYQPWRKPKIERSKP
jgi:hypothetical protein